MTKKILATILAIAMVITSMGTVVFAEELGLGGGSGGSVSGSNGWDGETFDTTWYDNAEEDATAYEISSSDELAGLAKLVNEGTSFNGKTITLTNDIDLVNKEWTPIGNSDNNFQGNFDGGNHTISNLKITANPSACDVGLFGFTTNGSISNIKVNNAEVKGYLDVGAIAGTPFTSTWSNITLTGDVKIDGYAYVGGLFGKNLYANADTLTINANDGSYVKANSENYRTYVGGIVGFMGEGGHKVSNATSNIDVYGSTCDVGGITGIAHYNNTFENCLCTGDVYVTSYQDEGDQLESGGIAGVWHNEDGTSVTFKHCAFEGTLSATNIDGAKYEGEFANGGLIGKAYKASGKGKLNIIKNIVQLGDTKYTSLAAAIDAADETNNEITLLCDASGDGVVIDKDIVIDLGGYTYTINGTLVGSKGTETLGLQILRDNNVTIKNGTILGSKDAIKGNESKEANGLRILIQNYSNLTLEDVTLDYGDADKIICVLSNNYGNIVLEGETNINTPAEQLSFDVYDFSEGGYSPAPEMVINTTGIINGAFEVSETAGLEIESGYFTHNPSAYLAEGMAAVTSDSSNAKFMIAEKKVDVETTVTPSSPSVSVEEGIEINTDNFAADTDDLNAASSTLANDSSVVGTKEDATAALEDAEITVTEDDTVSVVVVPYTSINVSNVNSENKTMTVNIEPKYDVIATTNSGDIKTDGEGKNAVVLNEGQTLDVTNPMTLTVALPADFAGENEETVYVHHEVDGTTYVYEATVSTDKTTATFTNPNGFSSTEFVVKKEAGAAKIDDAVYATLSDAVKNVKNNETIVLLANNAEKVTVAKTITFSLDKDVYAFTGEIDNGSYTKVTTTENGNVITYTFKYTSQNLGGGGGGAGGGGAVVSAYTIKVKNTDNGTVTSSLKTAKKGAVVTLSVTADEGYELKSITVTDNDNEEVDVTESNGEYSFKMPASDVLVTAEFVAEGTVEAPDDNDTTTNFPFVDIAEDFWGYEAIAYCFENGIMNGMTETEFDQARPLTRAMLVTMLYRLADTPEVVTTENEWYSAAQAWAMESGISDGTFMTQEVTREQLVTMLYRYAGMINADLTATAELTGFTDSADISEYAAESVKWAYASELINGMGDGTFAPMSSATRAQVATIFMRFIENIVK